MQKSDRPRPEVGLRVAILVAERAGPRRLAWIANGVGGIDFGIARGNGSGTKYSYHTEGGLFQSVLAQTPGGPRESQKLLTKYPPLHEVRGLLQFYSADFGAEDRLRGFPFKKRFDTILVRPLEGRVSFKMGLLEPGVPGALGAIEKGRENHFRLITKTEPWIVLWNSAGFVTETRR